MYLNKYYNKELAKKVNEDIKNAQLLKNRKA